jgi:putative holliday junction resolvase
LIFLLQKDREIVVDITNERTMALDVGDARVGVAMSDPTGQFVSPHSTIERKGKAVFRDILAIVASCSARRIVIGLPYELSGALGEQAEKVHAFADELAKRLAQKPEFKAVSIAFWDERLTTAQAERIIAGSKLKNRDRSALLDRVSAALILESFLDSRRSQASESC